MPSAEGEFCDIKKDRKKLKKSKSSKLEINNGLTSFDEETKNETEEPIFRVPELPTNRQRLDGSETTTPKKSKSVVFKRSFNEQKQQERNFFLFFIKVR